MDILDQLQPSQTLTPDPAIMWYLKNHDSKLDAFFNIVNERWTIVRFIPWAEYIGRWRGIELLRLIEIPWPIFAVQDIDGGYLPLDERTLGLLFANDLQRTGVRKWCEERDKEILKQRSRDRQNFRDDLRYATLENKRQLMRAFAPFDTGWHERKPPPVPMRH